MKVFLRLLIFILLGFATPAWTQENPASFTPEKIAAIDALIVDRIQSSGTPSVALALFENGRIVHVKGYGVADKAGREIFASTPFNLGSLTKSFTALALMQLAEEGRLDLDAPVIRYLPNFRTKDKTLSDQITVRQFMRHRSGFSTLDGNRNQVQSNASAHALTDAVARLSNVKLATKAGEAFAYSNANYQVLGLLLETLDSVSYEESIETRILGPLNLNDSFALNAKASAGLPAAPFRFWFSKTRRYNAPNGPLGRETIAQGGMFSSVNDLAVYLMDLASETPTLISKEGAKALIALSSEQEQMRGRGYGLGWFVRKRDGYTQVYHSGLSPGYQSLAGFVPERKLGFVVLTNASGGYAYGHVGGLTGGVMDLVLDKAPRKAMQNPNNKRTLFGVMMVPVFVLFWLAYAMARRGRALRIGRTKWMRGIRFVVPSLVLSGLAWGFAVYLPNAAGAPLSAAMQFNPDIGWALAMAAGTCGLWAVLRIAALWARVKKTRL